MLKATTQGFEDELFPELVQSIEALPQTLAEEALDVAVKYEPIIQAIAEYPAPRGDATYIWSLDKTKNDKARGWWFANLREGKIPTDGRHYRRTGRAKESFVLEVDNENGVTSFRIRNTWPQSFYVFGTLSSRGNADTRNPSHARDGWKLAKPIADDVSRQILEALIDNVLARIGRL